MNLQNLIPTLFDKETFIQATFSSPHKNVEQTRVGIRPIQVKGHTVYQISEQIKEKILHRNVDANECKRLILDQYLPFFKQALIQTQEHDYQILGGKKLISNPATKKGGDLTHNRKKLHLLPEGAPLPFLIELGLMNKEGKVFPKKMDKFRQINRFLEMVSDSVSDSVQHVVDFGCGKAYLTFALYHYLTQVKGFDVHVTGIDLKDDVVLFCQNLAKKLGFTHLNFCVGNIADYQTSEPVDMVVALHACDTATDIALAKAVGWKARVILAAPCCQHELLDQLSSTPLKSLLRHGILKERLASLTTDAARVELLEMEGYSCQILEFIDSQHTPKNLLIRAVKGNTGKQQAADRYRELKNALSFTPALERLLLNE